LFISKHELSFSLTKYEIILEIKKQYEQVKHQGSKYKKGLRKSQRSPKKIVKYVDPNYLKIMLEDSNINDILSESESDNTNDSDSDSDYEIE
jgi:hypothetical protein